MATIKSAIKFLIGNAHKGEIIWRIIALFRVLLPLRNNQYLCISMRGNSYGCSPKYIGFYIKDRDKNAKVIWAFSNIAYKELSQTTHNAVVLHSIQYYLLLFTSKYIISNERTGINDIPKKRKGQIYLQTWHGTALKKIEADVNWPNKKYENGARRDSSITDIIISGNKYQTNIFIKSFWYKLKPKEIGTPRNDIFFQNHPEIHRKVKEYLKVPMDVKLVLYAPTFRDISNDLSCYDLDTDFIISLLNKKFGGDFIMATRLHPGLLNVVSSDSVKEKFKNTVDATFYPDMQELLYSADVLITDYSSSMFDYMLSGKPCFLYTKDKKDYNRGFYISIDNLPFPQFTNNVEMAETIQDFDAELYAIKNKTFLNEQLGSVEDGHACERCYELLKSL